MTARLQESYRTFFTDCGEARAIQLRLRARLFGHLWTFIGILPDALVTTPFLSHLGGGWVRKIFQTKEMTLVEELITDDVSCLKSQWTC